MSLFSFPTLKTLSFVLAFMVIPNPDVNLCQPEEVYSRTQGTIPMTLNLILRILQGNLSLVFLCNQIRRMQFHLPS